MNIRKIAISGVLLGTLGLTAACGGSDDSGVPPVPPVSTTSSAAASSAPANSLDAELTNKSKRPSVDALNEMLQEALDPKIPAKDKTDLVEGSEVDPSLFNQLVKAAKENPDVTYKIKRPITPDGPGKAKVKVEVKLPDNPPTKMDAGIVYDNGRWKLSKDTVCPLLIANNVQTPLCPDSTKKPSAKKKAPAAAN
ncbi:MAG: hypothetical protein QM774_05655 [Gordonia sp. (in: high G+C Gram-positive bacteria)]|uniref:hypothetical protein n=1 Tax=Gordonia sp. (in: high G+C Gram-positive bacteria) TaxID=84139 RepID=UPI0039E283C0